MSLSKCGTLALELCTEHALCAAHTPKHCHLQNREIDACLKAADVDGDGVIGLVDFFSFAARLKMFHEAGIHRGPQVS
jgi:hypothetical protein